MTLPRRYAISFVGLVILLFFTTFFVVPIVWLLLAPTKTDGQLLQSSPFAIGSLSTLARTFHRVISYSGNSLLIWLKNSAIYSFGGTALAVGAAIPAGYGLALTHFVGRRTLLSITLGTTPTCPGYLGAKVTTLGKINSVRPFSTPD